MSTYVPPSQTLSEAWLRTLEIVDGGGGRMVNVLTTVQQPGSEIPSLRSLVDDVLAPGRHGGKTIQTVETVANTIFPISLYRDCGFGWDPSLPHDAELELDEAASDLYEAYETMLPELLTANGNRNGTYFGRMATWPGKEGGGRNQLADRIKYLRLAHGRGERTHNVADIAVGGEAEGLDEDVDLGIQTYSARDIRQRAFPCLVHVDLTLFDGRLSMLAVYRHQLLITKGYGNLAGLSRLLRFLAQQSGFEVGELAVQATLADAERESYGGRGGIANLIGRARSAMPT
jgi:hypothetical protein